ncbi:MAG: class I SAM-dependent RNA methyltransferase [Sulfitobacter litoralis]|uniref:23S rRNA m(5)U-1939 methyltransferase n=1 Tax=Sulfitobacter litoralis TaxID=335975 RepID=A0ABY0S8R0_9RHOB|nr:RsmD family RNA methyltransferase [Sulfitobacter litoralis]MBQ0716139.1 class I SAM-dependent RNA methyltransferase [Sulfitobacter litoralis]MBQ0801290.1 class I SAM-dependent RNA methyltransferase [Sulfitobacter litoralis]SDO92458.1 23S rRNA m(5)U-1939 methyltransferase [Sulfitobacter litoralis]
MTEYPIQRLGHLGDGIASGPLFAPMTLPGEVVTGTPDGQTLTDIRIVRPSENRVAPPCRHFKACGGCQLQHASDDFVAEFKLGVVKASLDAHGIETIFKPLQTSPAQSRRRATFAAKRTKKGAMAGFHGRGSDVVIEIPGCQLLDPAVLGALPIAEKLAVIGTSRKAPLAVTVTASRGGLDISVQNGKELDGPLRQELAHLCDSLGLARLTWDGEVIAMRTPPVQRFGAAMVAPPPGAFLQATPHGEAALITAVREAVGEARHVIDLFAGSGTFSLPLADRAEVHAVEGDAAMTAALDHGWRMSTGLKPVTTEARDLFRRPLLPDELAKTNAVVIDPPRAGAEAQIAEIVKAMPPVLAYVSCNPVTFARDAAVLIAAGYTLNWVQVVDQFRWSSHVELAAQFTAPEVQRKRK